MKRVVGLITMLGVTGAVLLACGDDADGDTSADFAATQGTGPGRALSTDARDGMATFYDADGSGNCSYAKSKNLDVAALAMPEYNKSASCGGCLLVKGPKGSVTVRVVDSCPGCAAKSVNLDMSASAFAKIAEPKAGKVSITYAQVACEVTGNMAYYFKDGSSKYWTAIQVLNHKVPVAKVEFDKGGSWVEMPRADYNFFIAQKGVGDTPSGLKLRITSTDDQQVEETLPGAITGAKTVVGKSQFR